MFILIGLLLSAISVAPKSIQPEEKAARNGEQREQENALVESKELHKLLRIPIRQAVQESNSSQAKEVDQEAFENVMEEELMRSVIQAAREAADPQADPFF